MLTVSVIIPVYQGAKTIQETIESVFKQTVPAKEIIVIDDGSTDQLEKALAPYRSKIILYQQKNAGAATARNTGLRHATGDLIAFLDADDLWLPEKIENQLPFFEKTPSVGVVFGNAYYRYQGQRQEKTYFDLYRPARGQVFLNLFVRNFIPLPSVIVRRSLLEAIGGFNQAPENYCEDYDLLLRLAQMCDFAFVSKPIVEYRISEQQKSQNEIKVAESVLKIKERLYHETTAFFERANPKVVKLGLYNRYLRLVYCYLKEERVQEARATLNISRRYPFHSKEYLFFAVLVWLPKPVIRLVIKIVDKIRHKPEYGFG